jgi:hypothetical protein
VLIAATNNLAALELDAPATRSVIGQHHAWTLDGTSHVVVCDPPSFRAAASFLSARGAAVCPHLHDRETPVGAAFAALAPASFGVLATDLCWAAARKIAEGAGWPHIDPNES